MELTPNLKATTLNCSYNGSSPAAQGLQVQNTTTKNLSAKTQNINFKSAFSKSISKKLFGTIHAPENNFNVSVLGKDGRDFIIDEKRRPITQQKGNKIHVLGYVEKIILKSQKTGLEVALRYFTKEQRLKKELFLRYLTPEKIVNQLKEMVKNKTFSLQEKIAAEEYLTPPKVSPKPLLKDLYPQNVHAFPDQEHKLLAFPQKTAT